jgi:hypothetical protein
MREIQNLIYGVMESSGSALHEFDLLAGWMHGYKYSPSLISNMTIASPLARIAS